MREIVRGRQADPGAGRNYPELKAGDLFENLQVEIEGSRTGFPWPGRIYRRGAGVQHESIEIPGQYFCKADGIREKGIFQGFSQEPQESPEIDFGS